MARFNKNMSSNVFNTFESQAENLEDMFPQYYIYNDISAASGSSHYNVWCVWYI